MKRILVIAFVLVMALVACGPNPPPPPKVEPGPNIGKTYGEMMSGMAEYFGKMEFRPSNTGEPRYVGYSQPYKASAFYEIIGEPGGMPVSRASMGIVISDGNKIVNLGNAIAISRFIQNVFPSWSEGPDLVLTHIVALRKAKLVKGIASDIIQRGNLVIQLQFAPEISGLSIKITPLLNK